MKTDIKLVWERVRGWYHYPPLKEPQVVKKLSGGACYDFRNRDTLVEEGFIKNLAKKSGLSEEKCLEGVLGHEIGHYMVFPRTLGTCILAAKMTNDFFEKEGEETCNGILQTYADMANDTASVLEEQRTSAILDVREGMQVTFEDKVNGNVREIMLAYLMHQAGRKHELEAELKPFFDRMLEIDFINPDSEKMRQGIWAFGNIIKDMIEKYNDGSSGGGSGKGRCVLAPLGPNDSDIKKILREATPREIKEALREISIKVTKREFEKIQEWLKGQGVKPSPPSPVITIGTSSGQLPVDMEVIEYYKQLASHYPIVVSKKLLETEAKIRCWSETEKWRVGKDAGLALPITSGGELLPGVTRSILISERPIKSTDYKVPHVLIVIDSSGSMPHPKHYKSYAVLGGTCAAMSYHVQEAYVGVINFSGDSFYLPYTRKLDDALGAISAYQGGGTVVDVEMVGKMLGPEMAELYKNMEGRDMRGLPRDMVKKELMVGIPNEVFKAESLDLIMFTDGGIANLNEVLDLFEEKVELNRGTIILTHGFAQEIAERKGSRIKVHRLDEDKDIPNIVIGDINQNLAYFAARIESGLI